MPQSQNHQPVVLMYHSIVQSNTLLPDNREEGANLYDVTLEAFEQQLQWLLAHDVPVQMYSAQGEAPGAGVILTFDDGERNNIELAWPVLRRFNLAAYFFVTVKRVGQNGYMNWEDLRELRDSGMVVGSHGLSHQILTGLKEKELLRELAESKAILEKELLLNVDDFSVPRGFYDEKLLRLAKEVGYQRIFVSQPNPAQEGCVGRQAVKANWSLDRFAVTIQGKTPAVEQVTNLWKDSAKKILGAQTYDQLRTFLLKRRK